MIDKSWSIYDIINNIETLKNQYKGFLMSFSIFERKKRIQLCRNFKKQIYSIKIEEHKKNLIWKYINDEIEYEKLIGGVLNNGSINKRNDRTIQDKKIKN